VTKTLVPYLTISVHSRVFDYIMHQDLGEQGTSITYGITDAVSAY